VFLNLLVNAAHAIADVVGDGGEKGTITVETYREENWAVVAISDTGSGIPEEIQSRIFDPFFTTKEVGKGTGQGLAISRKVIIDKHGGKIDFTSKVGEGTTFFIRLPIEDELTGTDGAVDDENNLASSGYSGDSNARAPETAVPSRAGDDS
ncbi:MAG: sensor histidine kinase, partial [Candidatus Zixiibacteriota bacterium]